MGVLRRKKIKEMPVPAFNFRKTRKPLVVLAAVAVLAAAVYVPAFVFPDDGEVISYYSLDVIETTLDTQSFPDSDYDKDGISNEEDSRPFEYNTNQEIKEKIIELVKEKDKKNGDSLKSPYETDCGVVLWADDYESKALGSVVQTDTGYYIYDFKGWAHFPEPDGKLAYQYDFELKSYKALDYNESQKAYKIEKSCFVQFLDEPVDNTYILSFFGRSKKINKGAFLSTILPSSGKTFLKCRADTDFVTDVKTVSNIVGNTDYEFSEKLLSSDTNTLNDLIKVYNTIKSGQNVFVLLSSEKRTSVGIINGIDETGNLLVINPSSKTFAGKIYVTPTACKKVNNDKIETVYLFDFYGFGYDSSSAIINFFDVC